MLFDTVSLLARQDDCLSSPSGYQRVHQASSQSVSPSVSHSVSHSLEHVFPSFLRCSAEFPFQCTLIESLTYLCGPCRRVSHAEGPKQPASQSASPTAYSAMLLAILMCSDVDASVDNARTARPHFDKAAIQINSIKGRQQNLAHAANEIPFFLWLGAFHMPFSIYRLRLCHSLSPSIRIHIPISQCRHCWMSWQCNNCRQRLLHIDNATMRHCAPLAAFVNCTLDKFILLSCCPAALLAAKCLIK